MKIILVFIFWIILTGSNFVFVLDAINDNDIFFAGLSFSMLIISIINLSIVIKRFE